MSTSNDIENLFKAVRNLTRLSVFLALGLVVAILIDRRIISFPVIEIAKENLPDTSLFGQKDEETGLIFDHGYEVMKVTCGSCHSLQLVTQNRFNRQGWEDVIRWMQAEQKLWDLGENEGPILDYLAKHLAPQKQRRRKKLENIDWYVLEN